MPGKKRGRGGKHQAPDVAHKKQKKAKPDKVPLPEERPEQEDVEIDDEDLGFVDEFEGNLGFLHSLNAKQLNRQAQKGVQKGKARLDQPASDPDDDDDLEAKYERTPRLRVPDKPDSQKAVLPTKSLHGELVYAKDKADISMPRLQVPHVEGITFLEDIAPPAEASDSELQDASAASGSDSADDSEAEDEQASTKKHQGKQQAIQQQQQQQQQRDAHAELQEYASTQERREEMKQQLAVTASKILQNPEAHLPTLKSLLALTADKDAQVAKLAMLSLLAVFKDILPGYRIRLPTEKELEIPVSKDVKQTRDYESMQLRFYQAYLKLLLGAVGSKGRPAQSPSLARVAARCMCGLLSALHHFNYSSDLLQAVVPLMVHQDTQLRQSGCDAIREVLIHDTEGKVAVAAVQLVADLVRRRKCQCPPELVHTLLVLKLKDATPQGGKGKKKNMKTKGRSKKSRRADEVEQAFKEAEATADRAAARETQSQMLLALFEIFFRVLKQCTQSGIQAQGPGYKLSAATAEKRMPLLMPSLQGLTKYAHLIDVDYFADLLQVMQQIMQMTALPLQQRLCCLQTASSILKGQGEALNIDRRELYARLYTCIPELAVTSLLPDSQGLQDLLPPGAVPEASRGAPGQSEQAAVVLLSVAQQMLLEQGKALDTARIAGFTKQFSCTALHLESGAALGSVALVNRLLRHNMKLRTLLEHEAGAPPPAWAAAGGATGGSDADSALAAAPLWELALLHRHYHPTLAQASLAVADIPPEGGGSQSHTSPVLATAQEPDSLAAAFSTDIGAFKPAPQPPRKTATPPKTPARWSSVQLVSEQAEQRFIAQLQASASPLDKNEDNANADAHAGGDILVAGAEEGMTNLMQSWFREQRQFEQNVALRQQCGLLSWQLQQFKQHLSQPQHNQRQQLKLQRKL